MATERALYRVIARYPRGSNGVMLLDQLRSCEAQNLIILSGENICPMSLHRRIGQRIFTDGCETRYCLSRSIASSSPEAGSMLGSDIARYVGATEHRSGFSDHKL